VTAAGRIALTRRYTRCPACGATASPLDERLGLDGFLSHRATRLACLAAASWSFGVAAARLEELAGIRLDDGTIRRHALRAAAELAARREAAPPRAAFDAAAGDVEFLADGVMAPTREGWRELKLAIYLKRPPGAPADPQDWASRALPGPTAVAAYASTADCDGFSAGWGPRARGWGSTRRGR
jgi:hypothetical protein